MLISDRKAVRTGTQCPPPGGFLYLILISHNEESQYQTPEEFGVFLQAGKKRAAQVLERLSLFLVHLVRAERRFFPQRGTFPVEGCRILAAEFRNARRQRTERCPDRVDIVEKCEGGLVYTIEGNVNDDGAQERYYVGDSCIFGLRPAGVLKHRRARPGLSCVIVVGCQIWLHSIYR